MLARNRMRVHKSAGRFAPSGRRFGGARARHGRRGHFRPVCPSRQSRHGRPATAEPRRARDDPANGRRRPRSRGSVALSQRKLNALGVPLAYVDRNQRYRFVNHAFLDGPPSVPEEVLGREEIEVAGRDVYQLYHAYIEAAIAGERTNFERQLTAPAARRSGSASIITPTAARRAPCAASSRRIRTSIT